MYLEHTYTPPELADFAAQLERLQEMIDFFQGELNRGRTPDPEPILKLMNCLVDLYS
jgi:hypothetical protein